MNVNLMLYEIIGTGILTAVVVLGSILRLAESIDLPQPGF